MANDRKLGNIIKTFLRKVMFVIYLLKSLQWIKINREIVNKINYSIDEQYMNHRLMS